MGRYPKSWFGRFTHGRKVASHPSYYLSGRLVGGAASREGRVVELHVERERLQSLVVNLTAEGELFPADASGMEAVNRLRLLVHLGVPEEYARELTGIYGPDDVAESSAVAKANLH